MLIYQTGNARLGYYDISDEFFVSLFDMVVCSSGYPGGPTLQTTRPESSSLFRRGTDLYRSTYLELVISIR